MAPNRKAHHQVIDDGESMAPLSTFLLTQIKVQPMVIPLTKPESASAENFWDWHADTDVKELEQKENENVDVFSCHHITSKLIASAAAMPVTNAGSGDPYWSENANSAAVVDNTFTSAAHIQKSMMAVPVVDAETAATNDAEWAWNTFPTKCKQETVHTLLDSNRIQRNLTASTKKSIALEPKEETTSSYWDF